MPTTAPVPSLDTFLTVAYVTVDDLYRTAARPQRPPRPGRRPAVSDSEVLVLAIVAQWWPDNAERAFLAYVATHWGGYFPRQLTQSAFNRRVRSLANVLAVLGPRVRQTVAAHLGPSAFEVLDGVPVPVLRRCRGERHRCFGDEVGVGRGGSEKQWYYGVHLALVVDQQGFITGWVVGPAPTGERWLAEALFRWRADPTAPPPTAAELAAVLGPSHHGPTRQGPTGPMRGRFSAGRATATPCLADRGFVGQVWQPHWRAQYGATVLTVAEVAPGPTSAAYRRWFNGRRQLVETVNGLLEHALRLWYPRARTFTGLLARLAAKVAAANLGRALNVHLGRPLLTHLNPFAL